MSLDDKCCSRACSHAGVYNVIVKIPCRILDITTDWLADLLPFPVASFQVRKIGNGYMSDVYRLLLEPDNQSIIVKISSSSVPTRDLADRFRSYEKEHRFYAELAELVSVKVPLCYFNFFDETGRLVLGLEDIGSQIKTQLTESNIILAARNLADLHSTQPIEGVPELAEGMRAAAVELKTCNLTGLYHDRVAELIDHYAQHSLELLPRFLQQPQVLSHMDFRLDNLGFTPEQVTLFDWGEFSSAPPGFDLAYFAVTSMTTEQRRAVEDTFLDTYVRQYAATSKESVLQSYQLCLLPTVYMPLLMTGAGNNNAAQQLANRLSAAIDDHYEAIRRLIDF